MTGPVSRSALSASRFQFSVIHPDRRVFDESYWMSEHQLPQIRARERARQMRDTMMFRSDTYCVLARTLMTPLGMMTHLAISTLPGVPALHDWSELQSIKNALCGENREACEIYPARDRLADSPNQSHLWVLPRGARFPFGLENRVATPAPEVALSLPTTPSH
jgi:hypothetical protein